MEPIFGCNMLGENVFSKCDNCVYVKNCRNASKTIKTLAT